MPSSSGRKETWLPLEMDAAVRRAKFMSITCLVRTLQKNEGRAQLSNPHVRLYSANGPSKADMKSETHKLNISLLNTDLNRAKTITNF